MFNRNRRIHPLSTNKVDIGSNTVKPKIYDCFIFYNELELLTYRLNLLNDVVDYFVLVESTHTFVGKEKPLIFNENKHLFSEFLHKIIHVIVDDMPYKFPHIDFAKKQQWENEAHQRNCIIKGIERIIDKSPNDIMTITDLDEFPNPQVLESIKNGEIIVTINTLEMDFYYYNLITKAEYTWRFVTIIRLGEILNKGITCHRLRFCGRPVIPNGGWHLSYFGDSTFIQNKIQNFSHQELNKREFTVLEKIEERISKSEDLYDRGGFKKIAISDNSRLPPHYEKWLPKKYYEGI